MPNPRSCPLPDGPYPATDQYRAKDPTCCPQQRTNWTFQPNSRAANRVCWVLHWDVSLFLLSSCLSNGCSRTLVNILMQIYDVKSTSQESKAAAFADLFPQLLWMLLEHSLRMLDSFMLCLSPTKLYKVVSSSRTGPHSMTNQCGDRKVCHWHSNLKHFWEAILHPELPMELAEAFLRATLLLNLCPVLLRSCLFSRCESEGAS